MRTLKLGDSQIVINFVDGSYIDKPRARNIKIDEVTKGYQDESSIALQSVEPKVFEVTLHIDLSHYLKVKGKNPVNIDFGKLIDQIGDIKSITLRDQTVAKEIINYKLVTKISLNIGGEILHDYICKNQTVDHREAKFEL